jgi:hypothetical protein
VHRITSQQKVPSMAPLTPRAWRRVALASPELLHILVSDILVRKHVFTIAIIGLSSIVRKMCWS